MDDETSLPIRGAWIEIDTECCQASAGWSLPIRGAWIEICERPSRLVVVACRSPSGERGLKYEPGDEPADGLQSLPIRGAWIEISPSATPAAKSTVAPHPGSVD